MRERERRRMTEQISHNRARHAEQIVRIRANPDLTEGAKRRQIAEANEAALREHMRLVEEEHQQRTRAIKQAERKLLGISYPEGAKAHEKAIIAMSYRDARDRAERAASNLKDDSEALVDLLDRAQKSGDAQLAEAVFHVATVRGDRRVADAYLAERPAVRMQWESYVAARKEAESITGFVGMATPPRTPTP